MGQWGGFKIKTLTYPFIYIFAISNFFYHKIYAFIIFISFFSFFFFDEVSNFPQQNINQSEKRIRDSKL